MLCWQFMVTLSDAIGIVLLAVMLGIVLLIMALQGIFWLYDCLKDKVCEIWRKMVY